jgi:signal transduction histidine kinase
MRRFRILFAAIAVVVVVPVGLLLQRAIASVELEKRARHQTVAERMFDEMERALSEMLTGEEERPFGQYSHEYVPPGQDGGTPVRSPLAEAPRLPFIDAYFQIDPDGTLRSPLRSSDDEAAPGVPVREIPSVLERTVAPYFRGAVGGGAARRAAIVPQSPGTTVVVSDDKAQRDTQEKPGLVGSVSMDDVLRLLNKGVAQRAGRQAKTELDYATAAMAPAKDVRNAPAARADVATSSAASGGATLSEPARLEIAPMVGRVIDPRHLLLYRTVVREAQTYRQGLLLDLAGLAAWLQGEALGSNDLAAYATVAVSSVRGPTPSLGDGAAFVYQHRFAEPFADLSARVALRPLPGVGGAGYVYALCAAVVVAGGLGLLAIYRMVSVTVAYAERRSNFVAAVSHELKTPLTAIRMYGEMLRDGIVPSEGKRAEYYGHITAESERLTRLINNVLEFSRLEKGTRQMSLATAALGPVVMEAAELLRSHAEREGFRLDAEAAETLPPVRFERDAVLQILFNLIDNAVKYARDSQPRRVSVTCGLVGAEVRVAVRDHGPGVEPRHLAKVFEPFYRGESELTRRSTGSGLGLALVRGLAAQMGARTAARNVPDGGFEVAVIFPASAA